MDDLTRVAAVDGVMARRIDDSVMLLSPDGSRALSLNETAAQVWEQCVEAQDVPGLVAVLANRYHVQAASIRPQVVEVLEELLELGFLTTR